MNEASPRLAGNSAVKLALMARQVRAQAAQVLRADPIAIIGMGCRLPGGASSPDRLWDVLRAGIDATREVPPDRWDGDGWYDSEPSTRGKAITKHGGFLDSIDGFDAGYFGIPGREADRMDPQQRLFLEVAIEALDDAGMSQRMLAGSRTGVFAASYHNDYAQLQYRDYTGIDARTLTGTLHSVLVNRLSYLLDLRGPSVSIDTACSASLVAVHLACQSLRLGESDLAVAGGVSLIVAPELQVAMSKVGFMAPDGRCKTFDERADGFGRGEGCSLLILKRLSDALADRDRVLAVIRGSAVNQDGRSTLLAAPNGRAQVALINEALAIAQLLPRNIGFIETHGTGTALGDPIEVEAIAETIGQSAPGIAPCFIGSVKANIGHLEAAAGATGVIKAVLAVRHGAIPPQANYHALNPHISLAGTRLVVPTSLTPWPAGDEPRCAAVSSFGVGGTNAHVIIEEAPSQRPKPNDHTRNDRCHLLPLSAKSPTALRELAESWLSFLAETPASIGDLCYTASVRRTEYDARLAVLGRSPADLRSELCDLLRAGLDVTRPPPMGRASRRPRIGFVFSGQGPQWHAMGRELLSEEPVFHDTMAMCDATLRQLVTWSLLDELSKPADSSRLDQTEFAQPALFALQISLAALWRSWGILPDAVIGHSVGEIAALHVAGALDLEEAVRIVARRGQIMQRATGLGRMASVDLTEADAASVVANYGDRLGIAAINSPSSVVLSGDPDALTAALAELTARGVGHRLLPVPYAFHSPQMEPLRRELVERLGRVRSAVPSVDVYSTVTGERMDETRVNADYFGRNLREPVRFAQAVAALAATGCDVLVELSPHPVLGPAITACVTSAEREPVVLASLRRGKPERETLMRACAAFFVAGCDVDWRRIQPQDASVVSLPSYCWQHTRHWLAPPAGDAVPVDSLPRAPLIGVRIAAAGMDAQIFEGSSADAQDWLVDHRVHGRLLLPAAAMIEMLLSAAAKATGWTQPRLNGLTVQRPLVVPEPTTGFARWQVVVKSREHQAHVALYEQAGTNDGAEPAWREIASAVATTGQQDWSPLRGIEAGETIDAQAVYESFRDRDVVFGPCFQCLERVTCGGAAAEAWITIPPRLRRREPSFHTAHPVLIDAGLQLCSIAALRSFAGTDDGVFLPIALDQIDVRPGRHDRLLARARLATADSGSTATADVSLETASGEIVAMLRGVQFARAERSTLTLPDQAGPGLYGLGWTEAADLQDRAGPPGRWLIFADRRGTAEMVTSAIVAAGGCCERVHVGTRFARLSEHDWSIDPSDPTDYARLMEKVSSALRGKQYSIVHLWSLDIAAGAPSDEAELYRQDVLGVGSVLHLLQSVTTGDVASPASVSLVTRGAQHVTGEEPSASLCPRAAGVCGLAGVASVEHPELRLRVIDLDADDAGAVPLLAELVGGREPRVAWRGARRWTPRLERYRRGESHHGVALPDRPARVELVRPGSFDGLAQMPLPFVALRPHEVRLRVLAAGLNFRDVLIALQLYPGSVPPLGAECAGVITEIGSSVRQFRVGDRAFGFAPASLATEVVVPAVMLVPIPEGMRSEDAAGITIAYLTAYYGLHHLAKLRPGERVLVHAAAGGVGLAAVQLAKRCGAEIFATAGSPAKRDLLHRLGITHVMDSRSVAFATEVMAATDGRGVDVVLNSLAGDFIPAGLRALAPGGRFLELGKRGIWTGDEVARLRPDVAYHAYDLGIAVQSDPSLLQDMFSAILGALTAGELQPLPVTVFPLARVQDAFRHMALARHVGKVVVQVGVDPVAQFRASAMASYWITGGLGALGLETACWLADAGAKFLVLSGRRPPTDAARGRIRALEERGVTVRVIEADAADRRCMAAALGEITDTMPPLRGVVHAAGMLRDGVLATQRWQESREVLRGKVHGAWVLHELTRELELEFFILYSAAGVLLGAPGQGVYPAANAELDALAHYRQQIGLPALSVAWGAWGGAGMAADLARRGRDVWHMRGLGKIDPARGFGQMERLLADKAAYGAVIPIDWRQFLEQLPPGVAREFFDTVAPVASLPSGATPPLEGGSLLERLRGIPSGLRRQALAAEITERILAVLGLDKTVAIEAQLPLKEIGFDSLMAVELRNLLVRSAGISLPATLLFDHPSLDALVRYLEVKWELTEKPLPADRRSIRDQALDSGLDELSDADAEALLAQELGVAAGADR